MGAFLRELLLRDQVTAQSFLGLLAGAIAPALTVLLSLIAAGADVERPLIGWQSLWQWGVMAVSSALFTPIVFVAFDRFDRTFSFQPYKRPGFRTDREMVRSRR